jgi:hypothetical protein
MRYSECMETATNPTAPLDCGHPPTKMEKGSCAAGVAVDRAGNTSCYACAEKAEVVAFRCAGTERKPFGAYLSTDPQSPTRLVLTTWTGRKLATVMGTHKIPTGRVSFIHGRTMESFVAVDPEGREWYGRGNAGIHCTVRRRGKN